MPFLSFLENTARRHLTAPDHERYKQFIAEIVKKNTPAFWYTSFSKVVRLFGKAGIKYSEPERKEAESLLPGWTPPPTADRLIRTLVILHLHRTDPGNFFRMTEEMFVCGDVGEQVALYSALSILPSPEKFVQRCAEGIRSNMGEVFGAVANNNVYPSRFLDDDAFNQMVLKCLFVGKPVSAVVGLKKRLNPDLARMASDFAHERWAAGREVSPELWMLVEPFPDIRKKNEATRFREEWKKLETL